MERKITDNPMANSLDEALSAFAYGKCTREELEEYLFKNEEACLEYFRLIYITDVDGIMKAIDTQKGIWSDVQQDGRVHSAAYFDRLLLMLDNFRKEVENSYLMEQTPPWWAYSISVDISGITLHLDYYADKSCRPYLPMQNAEEPDIPPDQTYDLIKVTSRLLKVEEYADIFGVDPPAVRAWIRRGKLPAAIKYGREWRIPELCDVGGRTYFQRSYHWSQELSDLPEEYSFLNDFSVAVLRRSQKNKKQYEAAFFGGLGTPSTHRILDIKEREHLEMILISNPLVELERQTFANVTHRNGQGVYLVPFDGSDDNEQLNKQQNKAKRN